MVNTEGELASCERLIEFADLEPEERKVEKTQKMQKSGKQWPPAVGEIKIKNLEFKYRPELENTLKNITFVIKPKEHVGIVGRPGAGKSYSTAALYKMIGRAHD